MVARSRSRSLEAEPLHINRCHLLFPIPCDIPGVLRGESNSAAELIKADEAGIAVRSRGNQVAIEGAELERPGQGYAVASSIRACTAAMHAW